MPNYRPYPAYQPSGIDWLGNIPTGWKVTKFRFLFSLGRGLGITKENLLDEGVPCINYGEIHSKYGFEIIPEKHPLKCVTSDYLETGVSALLSAGDFVFADTSEDIEGSGNFSHLNSDTPTFAGYHTVIARLISNDVPRYMAYLFDSLPYRYQIRKSVSGIKVFSITHGILKNCYLWLPQKIEQQQIASFLDRETAKIDQLIAKQQQLIELLKEKRQAVISHTVTKGLNPDVKMQPSGVEWLGDVPEHWVVAQLKLFTLLMQTGPFGSQLHAEEYVEDGIPVINPAHINPDRTITPDSLITITEETANFLKRHQLQENDIILGRRGELGRCAVIQSQHRGWICGTGSLKVTLNSYLNPEYVSYLISSNGVKTELSLASKGSTMDNLNTETLGSIRIPIPPMNEQHDILAEIAKQKETYHVLLEKAQRQIELLRERRSALISAAVTGKIDVRDWQANKEAA
jgi:type I restriction enzyme S subunit